MSVCIAGGVGVVDDGDTDGSGVVGSDVDGRFEGAGCGGGGGGAGSLQSSFHQSIIRPTVLHKLIIFIYI